MSLFFGIDKDVSLAYLTSIYNLATLLLSSDFKYSSTWLDIVNSPPMHLSLSRSLVFLLSKATFAISLSTRPFFFRSSCLAAHLRHNSGITYLATLEHSLYDPGTVLSIKSCAAHLTSVDEAELKLTALILLSIIHNL